MSYHDAIDRDWQKAQEDADNFVYCCVCEEEIREKEWPRDFTGKFRNDHLTEKCARCEEKEREATFCPEADDELCRHGCGTGPCKILTGGVCHEVQTV